MNKRLRNALTISAASLMLMGFGGLVSHVNSHVHADCTTALDQTDDSSDSVAGSVDNAENDSDNAVSTNASSDANDFLESYDQSPTLFNHYYLEPCQEKQYKVATIGDLADSLSLSSGDNGGYVNDSTNRNRIANSLDNNEETVYNDKVDYDATDNDGNDTGTASAEIDSSNDSDNVPLTNSNILPTLESYNNQINTAESNDQDNNNDAYDDVSNFLDEPDSGDNSTLFAHSGEEPNEREYELAVIGQLADQLAEAPDVDEVNANKANIKSALSSQQLALYNLRLGFDGAKLNLYIDANPYQYSTDPDAYYASNSTSTPTSHPRYHTGYFNSEGEWVKYHTGYYNKYFRWQKYHTGYFNSENRWVHYRTGYFNNENHWVSYY